MRARRGRPDLTAVAAAWRRLGVLFLVEPAAEVVDLERLVLRTAEAGRYDDRLIACAVAWLARYGALVNGRRLGRLLVASSDLTSAIVGAMLSTALAEAGGCGPLEIALKYSRPLAIPRPLTVATEANLLFTEWARADSDPVFTRWGLWYYDGGVKHTAVRPVAALWREVPELRVRAAMGRTP